jgi:ABC-type branched-subunit amino acid transport system permease subunit
VIFAFIQGADDGLHGFAIPAYLSPTDHRTRFYYLALVFFVVTFLAARRLVNSPSGRVMLAIRENENRATMIGFNTMWFKLIAFVASGMFAALAGALSGGKISRASKQALVAQWIRALACGARGRVFESPRGRCTVINPLSTSSG